MLDGEVDEVCVNQNVVGRSELGVVGEEESDLLLLEFLYANVVQLGDFAFSLGGIVFLSLIFLDVLRPVVDLEAGVLWVEHPLYLGELACLCRFCHLFED